MRPAISLALLFGLSSLLLISACSSGSHKTSTSAPEIFGPGGIACGAVPKAAPPSTSPWAGQIALSGKWWLGGDLYLVNPDGTGLHQVYEGDVRDFAWSPDGTRIAISSSKDGSKTRAIFVISDDSTTAKQLTPDGRFDYTPVWSPDGRRLAFASGISTRNQEPDLWVIDADGQNLRDVGQVLPAGLRPSWSWSPDGRHLAFRTGTGTYFDRPGVSRISIADADGANPRDVTAGHHLAWSPGGGCLGFIANEAGQDKIYLVSPDGSGLTRLTTGTEPETEFAWSRDGRVIAYVCGKTICTIRTDGSEPKRLELGILSPATQPVSPAASLLESLFPPLSDLLWSPDGSRLAFEARSSVYVINADGSGLVRITNNTALNFPCCWSPDGTKVAFYLEQDCTPVNEEAARICAERTKYNGLNIAKADGTSASPSETFVAAGGSRPSWSPVAKK